MPVEVRPRPVPRPRRHPRRLPENRASGRFSAAQARAPALTLATECPASTAGRRRSHRRVAGPQPDARMVVIDVFAKMRGHRPRRLRVRRRLRSPSAGKSRSPTTTASPFVLVHHVRKAGSDDFLTEVSGTNGHRRCRRRHPRTQTGPRQADGMLHVTGRDIDENEYARHIPPRLRRLDPCSTARCRGHQIGETRARSCATCAPTRQRPQASSPRGRTRLRQRQAHLSAGCSPTGNSPPTPAAGTESLVSPLSPKSPNPP